jgi:hypothetical protein
MRGDFPNDSISENSNSNRLHVSSREKYEAAHPSIGVGTPYHQITELIADKDRIVQFADALRVSHRNIDKDLCRQWTITGRHGHVQTSGDGYVLYVVAYSPRMWGAIKRKAKAFSWRVPQDGDSEGCFDIPLPDEAQAKFVRELLGLRRGRKEQSTFSKIVNNEGVSPT